MLNTILLMVTLLFEGVNIVLSIAAGRKILPEKSAEGRRDDEAEETTRRESRMDEGFENLMRFSVGGKDGFGSAEDE